MSPEELDEKWHAIRDARPLERIMRFAEEGLVLGAGTVLCPSAGKRRDIFVDPTASRLLTLLAAAHLHPAKSSLGLAHLRRAADRWREGDDALASMHLALSKLDRLGDPIDGARRLFMADSVLSGTLHSDVLSKALGCGSPDDVLARYNPDEPRVPAGNGRESGEWTSDGATSSGSQEGVRPKRGEPTCSVALPTAIIGPTAPSLGPIGEAAKEVASAGEIADSVSKWRELGPKGEIAIQAAVRARGWEVLDTQVYVRTSLGLRVEDVMVHVPAGTAGNATAYDGFIEVKVNGGRYSPLQQAKDALIWKEGGKLLKGVGRYATGETVFLGTGLANLTITYEPK
jgi:hypothetical protein